MPVYPVKSAVRVIRVLELFRERRQPLSLSVISTECDWPIPSTMSILKSLVELGYLSYNRQRRTYFPSPHVASLGDWIGSTILNPEASEIAHTLAKRTGQRIILAIQNDIYVQYLQIVTEPGYIPGGPKEGRMRSLVESGAGMLMLSRMTDDSVDNIVRRIDLRQRRRRTEEDRARIVGDVQTIRKQGYSLLSGRPCRHRTTISMLLPWETMNTPLAITVGGQNDAILKNQADFVSIMRETVTSARRSPARQSLRGAARREPSARGRAY